MYLRLTKSVTHWIVFPQQEQEIPSYFLEAIFFTPLTLGSETRLDEEW